MVTHPAINIYHMNIQFEMKYNCTLQKKLITSLERNVTNQKLDDLCLNDSKASRFPFALVEVRLDIS